MKLKMAENSLFAILLRSPWWVSVAVGLAIMALARALLPPAYVPFGAMGAVPMLVIGVMAGVRQWRTPSPARVQQTLQTLAGLGWREFAAVVEAGLGRDGHAVRAVVEPGFDFEATKAGRTVLVAARRWKADRIGIEPLRALAAAVRTRTASGESAEGWYLGLGAPSDAALQCVKDGRLRLVRGSDLARLAGPASGRHSSA
ncbi:MAG: restriction endonuclease [Burkholderiaceae bacterium]